MSRMHKLAALIVLAGAACSVCYAQDARIQYGDALDRSPLAGSGGKNTTSQNNLLRQRGFGLGQGSQLYVTGRVTGLGAFRGGLPYTPKGKFHLTLPSAGLSDFNRRSVGLEAVLRGQTYKANPYFSRASTVLGAGGILSGRTAVGTNIPKTTAIVPSLTRQLRVDASVDYQALLPSQPGRALSVPPTGVAASTSLMTPSVTTGLSKAPGEPPEAAAPVGSALPAWFTTRAGAISLFGALAADSRSRLARELYQMGDPLAPIDRRVNRYVDRAVDPEYKLGAEQTLPEELFATDANSSLGGRGLVRGPAAARRAAPRRNEDVYLDIRLRLRERQPTRAPVKQPSDTVETPVKAPVKSIVELDEKRRIVVHRLAGLGKDQLNAYMAIAQDRLKRGRYYEAVERFELVRIFDRANPLPLIGMGLAYFGAGEAYSAGLHFRAAIEIVPREIRTRLIESRIDVAAMMEIKDARAQLVNLERRLRGNPYRRQAHVYFAACFMSRNVGNRSEAIRYAEIIRKLAPENKIISDYAELVITGKLPKDMKPAKATTQKAKD